MFTIDTIDRIHRNREEAGMCPISDCEVDRYLNGDWSKPDLYEHGPVNQGGHRDCYLKLDTLDCIEEVSPGRVIARQRCANGKYEWIKGEVIHSEHRPGLTWIDVLVWCGSNKPEW